GVIPNRDGCVLAAHQGAGRVYVDGTTQAGLFAMPGLSEPLDRDAQLGDFGLECPNFILVTVHTHTLSAEAREPGPWASGASGRRGELRALPVFEPSPV